MKCHDPLFILKQIYNLNHRADVFHWWHRITLNGLTSLQIEERLVLRAVDPQKTKILLMSGKLQNILPQDSRSRF